MGKVLLSGYYGFGNTGDEAILASTIQSLRQREPDIGISVLSANPADTARTYDLESYDRMSFKGVLKGISSADLVVFGGGSLLQDATSLRSLLYYLSIIFASRAMGKPVVVYANGVGPIRSKAGRVLTKLALSLCKRISVRDPESERFLTRIGLKKPIRVTADPAFLLSPCDEERTRQILKQAGVPEGSRPVWLALRPDRAPQEFYSSFVGVARSLRAQGFEPCFFVMQERDLGLAESLNSSLSAAGKHPLPIVKEKTPSEALGVLGKGYVCVGMRLHALILAARAAVPFLGIDIDPKIAAFCRATGCPVLTDPETSSDTDLSLQIQRLLQDRDSLQAGLEAKLQIFKELAEENVDMVLSTLKNLPPRE